MSGAPAARRLVVTCDRGLGNRLKVLVSAQAAAEASGRALTMLWPLAPDCACAYERLFVAPTCVTTTSAAEALARAPMQDGWRAVADVLARAEPEVAVGYVAWLLHPERYPAHARLWPRVEHFMRALTPHPTLAARVAAIVAARFRPTMLGVHLRRGDFLRARPDVAGNTAEVVRRVDAFLARHPDAGIFLATDDGAIEAADGARRVEGVGDLFRRRWGERVVTTAPRTLDRATPEAIEDAVVDLWLLRRTDAVLGTAGSSFSELAAFGRGVPHDAIGVPIEAARRSERIARRTGLYCVVRLLGRLEYGPELPPFIVLWQRYRYAPERWLRGLVRRARDRWSC